jgi:hypothetical protein
MNEHRVWVGTGDALYDHKEHIWLASRDDDRFAFWSFTEDEWERWLPPSRAVVQAYLYMIDRSE